MIKMSREELERKLKRERVEVCLNCKRIVKCDSIGIFEECAYLARAMRAASILASA